MTILVLVLAAMLDPIVAVPAVIVGLAARRWFWVAAWAVLVSTVAGVAAPAVALEPAVAFAHVMIGFLVDGTLAWLVKRAWLRRNPSRV